MTMTREFGTGGVHAVNDAGEYLAELVPKGAQRSKKTFGEPFVVVFQQGMLTVARMKGLNGSDFRVWCALLSRVTQEHPLFDSDPAGIALDIDMHVSQVHQALSRLAKRGLIERPFKGKVALNGAYAWRGTSEARARYRKERELEL